MSQVNKNRVTEARLRNALRTVAIAIDCHGDVYWPIFEALKSELECLKSRRAQLAEFCDKTAAEDSVKPPRSRESANV